MWGTPQRSRRISTGWRNPGATIVSARRVRLKQMQRAATRMLFTVGFFAIGLTVGFRRSGRGGLRLAGFLGFFGLFRFAGRLGRSLISVGFFGLAFAVR